jgi:hypothetical protein
MKNLTRNLPKYSCIRPSTGKEIKFRPFLVSDEKTLLLIKQEQNPRLIIENVVQLLSSCFEDLDVDSLTLQDVEFLFCNLRSKSVGEIVKTNFTCPVTSEKIKTDLDLSQLNVSKSNTTFELALDSSFKIVFKEPTLRKIFSVSGKFDVAHLIQASIDKVYRDDVVYEFADLSEDELGQIIKNFTTKENEQVKNFVINLPKTYAVVSYTTSDGMVRKMRLDGVLNFFTYA